MGPAETLAETPPSAKLVFKALEYDGSLTQAEIAEETLLPRRTVRDALSRLNDAGLVEGRVSFRDARQSVYSLTDDGERATPTAADPRR
ncbi:helix-turn-helix transcriptional regulator [Halopiger aswanensis]|uniref:Winged helix-turn-helix DNA-binding protein n=1 Tax=Halopiger aswanensis TaxID=148449 RepID=A0A419VXU9_9EURY|nr:helix-turn-helix domain-containing protein [Halopiger aswanensis]RKD88055.1 winged helix-turn-helix DNA-binding protein [Halopiger aswanensis]